MLEYARQMSASFIMAYNQVLEQISALEACQGGNSDGQTGTSGGEGGSVTGSRDGERDTSY